MVVRAHQRFETIQLGLSRLPTDVHPQTPVLHLSDPSTLRVPLLPDRQHLGNELHGRPLHRLGKAFHLVRTQHS